MMKHFIRTYCLIAFLYSVWVVVNYVPTLTAWLNTDVYLFPHKNEAGQIWGAAFLMLVFYPKQKWKLVKYIVAFFLLLACALVQCRTAFLSGCITFIAFAFIKTKKKKTFFFLTLLLVLALFLIPQTNSFITHALFIDKYQGQGLDSLSSGRLGYIESAMSNYAQSPILGIGQRYVDCMPVYVLTSFGAVGLLFVLLLWICVFKQNGNGFKKNYFKFILLTLTVFYSFESLLEAYPPFGPGVASFMFWLLVGITDKKYIS